VIAERNLENAVENKKSNKKLNFAIINMSVKSQLESILFVAIKPLTPKELANLTGEKIEEVKGDLSLKIADNSSNFIEVLSEIPQKIEEARRDLNSKINILFTRPHKKSN